MSACLLVRGELRVLTSTTCQATASGLGTPFKSSHLFNDSSMQEFIFLASPFLIAQPSLEYTCFLGWSQLVNHLPGPYAGIIGPNHPSCFRLLIQSRTPHYPLWHVDTSFLNGSVSLQPPSFWVTFTSQSEACISPYHLPSDLSFL